MNGSSLQLPYSDLQLQLKRLQSESREIGKQLIESNCVLDHLLETDLSERKEDEMDAISRVRALLLKKFDLDNQILEIQGKMFLRQAKEPRLCKSPHQDLSALPQTVLHRETLGYETTAPAAGLSHPVADFLQQQTTYHSTPNLHFGSLHHTSSLPPPKDIYPGSKSVEEEATEEPGLKRSISLKKYASWSEQKSSSLEDPGLRGIVRGFPRKKPAPPPSAYSSVSWWIGFHELVDIGKSVMLTNRCSAIVKHALYRGEDVIIKMYSVSTTGFAGKEKEIHQFFSKEACFTGGPPCVFLAEEKGICLENDTIIFVREHCSRGSLSDILQLDKTKPKSTFKLSFWRKMNIAQSVAVAMDYLLTNGWTNPNLNINNILFTDDWEVKLADQSFRKFKAITKGAKDTLEEVDEPYLVFQFGLLLWKLVTETDSSPLQSGELVEVPKHCPNKLIDLILHCCNLDPEARPTFSRLVNLDAFDGIFCEADAQGHAACLNVWDKVSRGRDAVPWDEFAPFFCSAFEIPYNGHVTDETIEFLCLRSMFDLQASTNIKNRKARLTIVTQEAFHRLIKCIGPFIEGGEILDQVKALLEAPWFMGVLSAQEADELIEPLQSSGKPFLVRFSSSTGDYSITFKTKDRILHSRVPQSAKYNLHQYVELLKQKKKFRVSPPSPFAELFVVSNQLPGYRPWTFVR